MQQGTTDGDAATRFSSKIIMHESRLSASAIYLLT